MMRLSPLAIHGTLMTACLAVLDLALTVSIVSRLGFACEANPMARWSFENAPLLLIFNAPLRAATAYLIIKSPLRILWYAGFALDLFLVLHNAVNALTLDSCILYVVVPR